MNAAILRIARRLDARSGCVRVTSIMAILYSPSILVFLPGSTFARQTGNRATADKPDPPTYSTYPTTRLPDYPTTRPNLKFVTEAQLNDPRKAARRRDQAERAAADVGVGASELG